MSVYAIFSREKSIKDPHMLMKKIDSPLGTLIAISDDHGLRALDFEDGKNVQKSPAGKSPILDLITHELGSYFKGDLTTFTTPLSLSHGTPFQRDVWNMLMTIPYGKTWSYAQLAKAIERPTAHRAVANANGKNQLALIIPCHRVISTGGALGGYGGGLMRKEWLLSLERGHG